MGKPIRPLLSTQKIRRKVIRFFCNLNLILPIFFVTDLAVSGGAAYAQELDEAFQSPADALFFKEAIVVEGVTNFPKPLLQVAENVTIVTARVIEAMNAHTMTEVLNRVAGVFVGFYGQDFGSSGSPNIQGAHFEQALILVDGLRWNTPSGGYPETNNIPVRIIDRIEIIKGPASSTWGSALGGVVNIITKEPTDRSRPTGTVSASLGEHATADYGAEAAGTADWLGYYLYAGGQESDGLENDRFFENENGYAKLRLALTDRSSLTLTAGYSNPYYKVIDAYKELNPGGIWTGGVTWKSYCWDRVYFVTANFDTRFGDRWSWNLAVNGLDETVELPTDFAFWRTTFHYNDIYEDSRQNASTRLTWTPDHHTVVVGSEITTDTVIYRKDTPSPFDTTGDIAHQVEGTDYAVYINDTWTSGQLAITPGLRYDELAASDAMVSPSLGATYCLTPDFLLRAVVARGFKKPDKYKLIHNPDLNNEKVWSGSAGVETTAIPWLRVKATGFHHRASDIWASENGTYVNNGDGTRTGLELEAETASFHRLSLAANFTYVYLDLDNGIPADACGYDDQYLANLILRYDHPDIVYAELSGHYMHWAYDIAAANSASDLLWDLNLHRRIAEWNNTTLYAFATAHNLFDGRQYFTDLYPNPGRWLEAGLRFRF